MALFIRHSPFTIRRVFLSTLALLPGREVCGFIVAVTEIPHHSANMWNNRHV